MADIEQEFIKMISLKQEKLAHDQIDDTVEKYIDLHQEYMMTQNTDYSRDYREIDADWSMTDGEKDGAHEKIKNLVDYQHERGLEIENEMSVILTKEFMPPYPISDIDIQKDGNLYYVGRQININGEWLPYTNDSNQHFDNNDEAIKKFADMKVDQITNKIGIDLLPLVPNINPVLMNESEIERKILGKAVDLDRNAYISDPETEKERIKDYRDANTITQKNGGLALTKDSIPHDVRNSIEKTIGKIEYSNERIADRGHFAVVKDHKGHYNSLQIDKSNEGFHINVKAGFPDHEQAYNHAFGQYTNEIEKHMKKDTIEKTAGQELSR